MVDHGSGADPNEIDAALPEARPPSASTFAVANATRRDWRYIPLRDVPLFTRMADPAYWSGAAATAAQLRDAVARGYRVAVLPERSGLVILDCDVRQDWICDADVARLGPERRGVDDLAKLAAERGMEIEPTYTVQTPSGGAHLYFTQNSHCPVSSHGHRTDWLIDVKASPNTYAVAPPTTGYVIASDVPVAVLPYWLARHVRRLGWRPERARRGGEPFVGDARQGIERFVSEANTRGGWNNSLYWAACRFGEGGISLAETTESLIGVAQPWNESEQRRAVRTIESGWGRTS